METVTLNLKEQKRLMVLNRINQGKLTGEEAADLLGLSVRHVRRLLARFREEGARALAHGNRGRPSHRRIEKGQQSRIVSLAKSEYAGVNQQHFTELLAEREQLRVSRSTVRRVLAEAGLGSPRPHRRKRRHRLRRERYSQEGMLVQIDGSPHNWLEARGPRMTLLTAIDDATGKVLGAVFRQQEDAQGYFLLLRQIVERYGRPLAIYRDRHRIFERETEKLTLEDELEGRRPSTQFARLLVELDVRSIRAYSPQAKGRVERLFGTLQDRLVAELRLNQTCTLPQANQALKPFLPRFNKRFSVPSAQKGRAYRRLPKSVELDRLFSFKFHRTVSADNIVRLGEHHIQLQHDADRSTYAHCRVEIQQRMDGSLAVFYQNRCLTTQPAPAEAPVLRLKRHTRRRPTPLLASATPPSSAKKKANPLGLQRRYHPPRDHPWRRPLKRIKPETLAPAGDIINELLG